MLPRAAVRAAHLSPALPCARISYSAIPSQWNRAYASKPKRKDNTWKKNEPIKFADQKKTPVPPVKSSTQPEFDTVAAPEKNTTPTEPSRPQTSQEISSRTINEAIQRPDGESRAETSSNPAEPAPETPPEPQKPLPDLRQGIPSTFASEYAEGSAKASEDPNDPTIPPGTFPGSGRDGGELPRSAYETSTDRRRNRIANLSYLAILFFGLTGAVFMGRPWESEEEEKAHPNETNGWGPGEIYARAVARINGQKAYYTEPTFEKLLPDKDKIPGGAPELTLVLSLEDLLLHSEWSTKHGYRMAKRPGLDYFLRYLSSQFELVIFTSAKSMDADPVIRKLDPFRLVMWPLFREATRFEKGEYIKDLSYLNRDLSKVIIIDTDPAHVKLQPENAIILPKWKGESGDKGLIALLPFLEYLAMMSQTGQPIDVRTVLASMKDKNIPIEYARREAKLREAFNRDLAEQKRKAKGSAGGLFMKSLGFDGPKPGLQLGDQNLSQGLSEGKMMIDMFRDFNRQNYEHLTKQIEQNGEQWLKEMAEEEKKMQEAQLKDMKAGAFNWLGGPNSASPPDSVAVAANTSLAAGNSPVQSDARLPESKQ